MKRTNVQV